MISIVGLGNAVSAIVECFKDTPQYNVFKATAKLKVLSMPTKLNLLTSQKIMNRIHQI